MDERTRLYHALIKKIVSMGYPEEFGVLVADNLRTEKTMSRMLGYLRQARPASAEEIADEMLAIMDDRTRWIQKKEAEYYNRKYNELLYYGLGEDDEEDPRNGYEEAGSSDDFGEEDDGIFRDAKDDVGGSRL